MSTADAVLLKLDEVNGRLARLEARLDATSPRPWPDRLNTTEAVLYVKQAYRRPFAASTLYRWCDAKRLTEIQRPRRWLRSEIDALLGGVPMSNEGRGKRRPLHDSTTSQQGEVPYGGAESPSDRRVGALEQSAPVFTGAESEAIT